MIRFSKKVEYALIAMLEMAGQQDQSELVTAKSLAMQYEIPSEILGKVLQTLAKNGLLLSVQGMKGGYTLAAPAGKINLWQIVQAVDGPVVVVPCLADSIEECGQHQHCNIRTPMQIIQTQLESFFSDISLSDVRKEYLAQFNDGNMVPGQITAQNSLQT